MKKDPLYKLLTHSNATGLLCNQSSWNCERGQYSFQSLATTGKLKKVFIPEHGLFGELQDQVKLDDTSSYRKLDENIEWISLYNSGHGSLTPSADQLKGIDTLIIDIQDTGSRYYTFTSTTWLLLEKITALAIPMTVIVFDKPNPAGRQVEGTRMTKEYASFIGLEGLPHRHGLTMGELCRYFKNKLSGKWELLIIPSEKKEYLFIPPSPNIPSPHTCTLYSGQSLWEGTNISEGRGTTLPFEMIGAPFIDWMFTENWNDPVHPAYDKGCYLRPVRFIPVFHKHQGQVCEGLQLLPKRKREYHSLSHSLRLIKHIKDRTPQFAWRDGKYEAFNDRKAIELLVGDRLLLDFLDEKAGWKEVKQKIMEEERQWIKEASPFRIYKSSLKTLKFK
jgi:uncharacterized protein YbbC (DUF1343 family)